MNKIAFMTGAQDAIRRFAARNAGPLVGAASGMLMSTAVAPQDDRFRYLAEGAVIGGLIGHARVRHAQRRWHGVIG